jgi:HPt (histidine-containing phosphotransfer) domain-containing protein
MGQCSDPRHAAGPSKYAAQPVDLDHLSRYTLGDAHLEREVLQLFVTQSRIYLNRMKEARDSEQWRIAAHTIKGSARGIGAWAVAERAEHAERLGQDVGEERCRKAIAALESEVRTANDYIKAMFVEH